MDYTKLTSLQSEVQSSLLLILSEKNNHSV